MADHVTYVIFRYQIWTAVTNLHTNEEEIDPTGTGATRGTGTGTVASVVAAAGATLRPGATRAVSFEGMIAGTQGTPTHEKSKFGFSRRGSAVSNPSLGPVAEEPVQLDLRAFEKV